MAQTATRTARDIQQALLEKGYAPGTIDGVWGKKSVAALKLFQQARGLPVTGVIDDRVTRELFPTAPPQVQPKTSWPAPAIAQPDVGPQRTAPAASPQVQPGSPVGSGTDPTITSAPPQPAPTPPTQVMPVAAVPPSANAPASSSGGLAAGVFLLGMALIVFAYRRRRKRARTSVNISYEQDFQSVRAARTSITPSTPQSEDVSSVPAPAFRQSLAAHSADVANFITQKNVIKSDVPRGVANPEYQPAVLPNSGRNGFPVLDPVAQTIDPKQLAQEGRPLFGGFRRVTQSAPTLSANHSGWVPVGSTITVGDITISGGMIYTGTQLRKQGASSENENCLINPKLAVSKAGDPRGSTMGYWPSYSQITGEARRSYLEWLSGSRSDPAAYIGYVFLYFYGLERRLMLEDSSPDTYDVLREVRRLVDIYGYNNSFSRYAHELLSAFELKAKPQDANFIPDVEGNGFDVPTSIKMALGIRVRDGRLIEPQLLLKYARTHPETRVRTPARRAPELLEALFIDQINSLHPNGVRVGGGRFKMLKSTYRACSGSFTVDVAALGGSVPDITERAEPIGIARTVFEKCSDELDEYSRALGRSPGLKPTLSVLSKLPFALRQQAIKALPGKPLDRISSLSLNQQAVSVRDLAGILDVDLGVSVGKTKLRELSQLMLAIGYGNTADPVYALRQAGADDQVVVFKLDEANAGGTEPSETYRSVQLSIMLGMVVGHADGSFDEMEKRSLTERIEASHNLTADERVRLKCEVRLTEMDASRLSEWTKRLKDVPASARTALAAELVSIAGADGTVHAAEVKALEGLFKRMGLDPQSLYTLLHESGNSRKDDDLSIVIEGADGPSGLPIPPEPKKPSGTRIDLTRLNAIRNETRATASVLADIFVEETDIVESTSAIEVAVPDEDDMFEGLERRYGSLVSELRTQETWTASDFDSLVRGAGLMPGAARDAVNDWAMDRFDELLIEGDGPYVINSYLLPPMLPHPTSIQNIESAYA
ncbi:TerB N-terminal domain-containing protein [Rhizobium leguminosarum]|uniref:TerB N-terminal domain-containing protein n=1 Tax=Rhizobium leguminosarum TaxID=384 RepID=UPI0013EE420D|nr:TerB N-terminal domain-containing protein [Rhizobium leguminosarum]